MAAWGRANHVFQEGTSVRCPKCWRSDVRVSMRRGLFDAIASAFSLVPFRCRACWHRFYRRAPAMAPDSST